VYNVNTHESRFIGNVVVTDPQYKITSKELGYNTETKMQTFYDYSVVTSDSGRSVLSTWKGTYDTKNVIARFTGHSSIWNDGQYIEADSMHYDKTSGYGFAIGNVISIDTAQHATIYCGRADYFRKKRVLWAILKPIVELATGKDTFYMRADTFYSASMIRVPGKAFVMPVDTAGIIKDTTQVSGEATIPVDSARVPAVKVGTVAASDNQKGKSRRKKPAVDTVAIAVPEVVTVPDSMWAIPVAKYRMEDFVRDTAQHSVVIKATEQPKRTKKKQERKDNAKDGKSFDDMIAYIDENGNLSSTPPDPRKMIKINVEDIEIGVPKQKPFDPADLIRKGTVTFFNESKGYGFIKEL
jgi:hypothetical protein